MPVSSCVHCARREDETPFCGPPRPLPSRFVEFLPYPTTSAEAAHDEELSRARAEFDGKTFEPSNIAVTVGGIALSFPLVKCLIHAGAHGYVTSEALPEQVSCSSIPVFAWPWMRCLSCAVRFLAYTQLVIAILRTVECRHPGVKVILPVHTMRVSSYPCGQ